jgi:hypothetical protein
MDPQHGLIDPCLYRPFWPERDAVRKAIAQDKYTWEVYHAQNNLVDSATGEVVTTRQNKGE